MVARASRERDGPEPLEVVDHHEGRVVLPVDAAQARVAVQPHLGGVGRARVGIVSTVSIVSRARASIVGIVGIVSRVSRVSRVSLGILGMPPPPLRHLGRVKGAP